MVRGLYTAAAGALVAESQVDNIANNLANVNTSGFKRTLLQIQTAPTIDVYRMQTDPGATNGGTTARVSTVEQVGTLGTGAEVYDTPAVFDQGALEKTDNTLDVGINGNAFFAVQSPAGIRYTRDGQFVLDGQGYLTTQSGDRVLGQNGAILLQPGDVQIANDGTISQNGRAVDQLRLTQFGNLTALRPEGDNRFVNTGAAGPAPATNATVHQGFLEGSNANVVRQMVDMISAERWFEANQKVIQTQDEATSQAVTTVGRTQNG